MSTLKVQFITQSQQLIDVVGATVDAPGEKADKIMSDLTSIMVEHIQRYSSLLPVTNDSFIKGLLTHAMLVETLMKLKGDMFNLFKIVAVCYLIRKLETDEPVKAIKLTIDNYEHIHELTTNSFVGKFEVVSTTPS